MKKLILSAVVLAGLAIVSCSKDDDKGGTSSCVTCDFGDGEDEEICRSDFGLTQSQWNAYVDALEDQEGVDCN